MESQMEANGDAHECDPNLLAELFTIVHELVTILNEKINIIKCVLIFIEFCIK